MNERDFCYWLQGFIEISNAKEISPEQVKVIQDHLKLVFTKVTPTYPYQSITSIGGSSIQGGGIIGSGTGTGILGGVIC